MRLLAAMSGGVDSAVAAARAVDAGHDVTGVHLALSEAPQSLRTGARGCCSVEDARDARRSADVLGIPFYVWDMAGPFRAGVVDDFLAEYTAGRTPNPCVRCNERVKFAAVLDKARALGFDAVCTGHYARLTGARLRRARDDGKDQSYVLASLTPDQLGGAVFPVGDSLKPEIRAEAAQRGLAVASKPDSHDICFIADGDTRGWLRERLGEARGDIVDAGTGEIVGRHDGVHGFTVGQRRGLRLGRPAPDGRPRFVLEVSPVTRTVTVGAVEALEVRTVRGRGVCWHVPPPAAPLECLAQLRAHGDPEPAVAVPAGDDVVVEARRPLRGVAPGQLLVLYDGDVVLAAARIAATRPAPTDPIAGPR